MLDMFFPPEEWTKNPLLQASHGLAYTSDIRRGVSPSVRDVASATSVVQLFLTKARFVQTSKTIDIIEILLIFYF